MLGVLIKEHVMSRDLTNKWARVADEEFEQMDSEAQRDWAELRKRTARSYRG